MTIIKLKYARLRKKWSQQTLGFYAKVAATEISKFENGYARPYPDQVKRLAKVLDLNEDELFEKVRT